MSGAIKSQLALVVVAAALIGCGGDSGGPSGPSGPTLATVEMPDAVTILNSAPGNTAALSVTPRDETGSTITAGVTKAFTSDNVAVATVSADGTVTAVSIGTARITVTVKVGSVTRTGTTTVTVAAPPAATTVTAPDFVFLPGEVHVAEGGTVTWTIGAIHHTVTFTTPGAPSSIGEMLQESVSRSFPTKGSYNYHCTLHAGMSGTVYVH